MSEERRNESVGLGRQRVGTSVGHFIDDLGNSIACVCHPLRIVCLGHRKNLALTTAVAASAADLRDWLKWALDAAGAG